MKYEKILEYWQDLTERDNEGTTRNVGRAKMECRIAVDINLDEIARCLGAKACRSVSGQARDGFVKVRRVGAPKELQREIKPKVNHATPSSDE